MTDSTQHKLVSPLRRLLILLPMDDLLLFLHRSKLQFVLLRDNGAECYRARIFLEGMLKYECADNNSPKAALCDAIAKFLIGEQKDYHDYGWQEPRGEIK